ncbi:VWA domain-containing protein, partial [Acinetobacter baumannii]
GNDIEAALGEALDRYGSRSTDYGRAFADFAELAMADVDHRTTVLILGDARSNYGDPRTDILKQIHDRARRVLFLNPEPRGLWGAGDSEMKR